MKNWFQKPIALIIFGLIVVALSSYNYYAGQHDASARNPVLSESKSNTTNTANSNVANTTQESANSSTGSQKTSQAVASSKSGYIPYDSNSSLTPDPNQFIMSDDEMAAELKKFQQSNGSSNASSSSASTNTPVNSSTNNAGSAQRYLVLVQQYDSKAKMQQQDVDFAYKNLQRAIELNTGVLGAQNMYNSACSLLQTYQNTADHYRAMAQNAK